MPGPLKIKSNMDILTLTFILLLRQLRTSENITPVPGKNSGYFFTSVCVSSSASIKNSTLRYYRNSFLVTTTEQRNIEQPIPYFSKSKQSDDYVTDFWYHVIEVTNQRRFVQQYMAVAYFLKFLPIRAPVYVRVRTAYLLAYL